MKELIEGTWKLIVLILTLLMLASWIAIPENKELNLIITAGWLITSLILIFPRRKEIISYLFGRQFKSLLSNTITIFLTVAIVAMINFIVYQKPKSIDFTKQKVNTLSDQTLKILDQFNGPIKIELYARTNKWPLALSILELLRYHKNDIEIEAFDIEKELLRAKAANITQDNSVLFKYNGKQVVSVLSSELSISNSLIRLLRQKPFHLGFTQNHGEILLSANGNEGIQFLLSGLKANNHDFTVLDLTKTARVEHDLILIVGPKVDFSEIELRRLKEFLLGGGKLLVAFDPVFDQDNLPNLRSFLKEWGFKVGRDIVVDKMSTIEGLDASVIMSKKYNTDHLITRNLVGKIIFPLTSSVLIEDKEGYDYSPLIYSSDFPASWAELDLSSLSSGKVVFDDKDIKGPVPIAAALEKKYWTDKRMRMIVFGTARFLLDGYRNQETNYNLLMNSITWLVEEDRIISLNRPAIIQERIHMSQTQLNVIFYFSIIFLPLLLLGLATYTYRRKQRL